jgi:alpha-galactosidase
MTDAELVELTRWVALHEQVRGLLHSGVVVNADHPDPEIWISGVIAQDGRDALFEVTAIKAQCDLATGPGAAARTASANAVRRVG